MAKVHQGDIVYLEREAQYALVLSRDFFNRSGLAVLCPVMEHASRDALHIPVSSEDFNGIALIEQLKTLDLEKRLYRTAASLSYAQIQNLSDAVQGIFDYYPYG